MTVAVFKTTCATTQKVYEPVNLWIKQSIL